MNNTDNLLPFPQQNQFFKKKFVKQCASDNFQDQEVI